MTKIQLKAQARDITGKKVKQGRREGLIPAVVYGNKIKPKNVWVNYIDFNKVYYITDTGRRWDGGKMSVRDKVGQLDSRVVWQLDNINSKFKIQNSKFHSTSDIITAANRGLLPDQIMLTFHPQRWTDKPLPWLQELVLQNVKNVVKRLVLRFQG